MIDDQGVNQTAPKTTNRAELMRDEGSTDDRLSRIRAALAETQTVELVPIDDR